jgi:hypothetical protein
MLRFEEKIAKNRRFCQKIGDFLLKGAVFMTKTNLNVGFQDERQFFA